VATRKERFEMEKILTKDQILQAEDIRRERVEVPEWGGDVFVRTMTGSERDQLEISIIGKQGERNLENLRAKIVALSVVDEEGNRVFSFEDTPALALKSARAMDRVFAVAQRLSGFTPKDVEELTKNSSPGQSEDSISG